MRRRGNQAGAHATLKKISRRIQIDIAIDLVPDLFQLSAKLPQIDRRRDGQPHLRLEEGRTRERRAFLSCRQVWTQNSP